jgi:hypothetical protein
MLPQQLRLPSFKSIVQIKKSQQQLTTATTLCGQMHHHANNALTILVSLLFWIIFLRFANTTIPPTVSIHRDHIIQPWPLKHASTPARKSLPSPLPPSNSTIAQLVVPPNHLDWAMSTRFSTKSTYHKQDLTMC